MAGRVGNEPTLIRLPPTVLSLDDQPRAGGGNRTLIKRLEISYINHYTTPANVQTRRSYLPYLSLFYTMLQHSQAKNRALPSRDGLPSHCDAVIGLTEFPPATPHPLQGDTKLFYTKLKF